MSMSKLRRSRYYIDEGIRLMKTIGGNKRTGSGGLVVQSQIALTCRTCYAVVGGNHLESHIATHTSKPVTA